MKASKRLGIALALCMILLFGMSIRSEAADRVRQTKLTRTGINYNSA